MGAQQSGQVTFVNPSPRSTGSRTKPPPQDASEDKEKPPPTFGTPEYAAAEIDKSKKYWEDRLNRLEESHKRLSQKMLEANAEAQVEMEKILPRVPEKDAQPLCKALLDKVMKCYQSNGKETLKCSGDVKAYKSCLGEAIGVIIDIHDVDPLPDDCQKELILEELKKKHAAKKKHK